MRQPNQDDLHTTASNNSTYGHEVYSKAVLAIYNTLVIRLSNPLIWGCPSRHLLQLYNQHMSSEHLDVGVGTGYFLKHAKPTTPLARLGLIDLNTNCLQAVSKLFNNIPVNCDEKEVNIQVRGCVAIFTAQA